VVSEPPEPGYRLLLRTGELARRVKAALTELGGDYFDRLNTDRLRRYHTKRLAALGYAVTLRKSAA
jgi:hypothetical protein